MTGHDGARETAATAAAGEARRPLVSGSGILIGCIFFVASLTPSLVPRTAVIQGLIGGTVFAFGYGVAVAALGLWRWLELRELHVRFAFRWAIVSAGLGLAIVSYGLWRAPAWQTAVRAVLELQPAEDDHTLIVVSIAAGTALVLFVLAWVIKFLARLVANWLRPVVPPRVAILAGLITAFALFGALVEGVLLRSAFRVIDASYARLDQLVQSDSDRPSEPWRTGSTQSLVPWDSIGRDGRNFLRGLSTEREIADFWGSPAAQPLRVYVGLGAADEARARARLALGELKRVGAFDREILVVAMPTGTGFMDEGATDTLEYLHRGDVATVAVQYSYLQSPFSLIFQPEYGSDTASALLRTVYAHWTELAEDERPRLFLYGLSLGTLNSERALSLYEMVGDPIDGALWAGPPFLSPIHADMTRNREPGSPEWLPRFGDGALVRFMNQRAITNAGAEWGPLRILYLQNGSDPIVFFSFPSFWNRPDWLKAPRAPDVSDAMAWYPVVTGLQLAADMALANNAPRGYGHQYAASRYVDAWATLTTPEVADATIARLKARFDG